MITVNQVALLARKNRINESVIFREYLQILFLSKLYSFEGSEEVFFKGGTALHLIFKTPRFSEDLDFTVELSEKKFLNLISGVFENLAKEEEIRFEEKEAMAGKRFLLTASPSIFSYKIFINLDFSFREKVLDPQKSILDTVYPVLFSSFIYHFSKEEIFAEKIRTVLTRNKGRDIYDLWFLISQGVQIKEDLIKEKLKYYNLENIKKEEIIKKIDEFSEKMFIQDLRPFVPTNERENLSTFFRYLKDYLREKLLLS